MKTLRGLFARTLEDYSLSIISVAAAALIVGCGGEQNPSFQIAEAGELNLTAEGSTVGNQDALASGTQDGGAQDGGTADGGTADGGTADGGTADGGTADGGTADGGSSDDGDATSGNDGSGSDNGTNDDSGSDDGTSGDSSNDGSNDGTPDDSGDDMAGDDSSSSDGTGDDGSSNEDPNIETEGTGDPTPAELAECANWHGVAQDAVVVAGNNQTVSMGQVAAVKAVGNQPNLRVNMNGGGDKFIAGICIFAAGNQANVEVNVGVTLGALFYKGRGNKSSTTVNVAGDSALQGLFGDLSGNQASLTVQGQGSFPCHSVTTAGNNSSFTCQ